MVCAQRTSEESAEAAEAGLGAPDCLASAAAAAVKLLPLLLCLPQRSLERVAPACGRHVGKERERERGGEVEGLRAAQLMSCWAKWRVLSGGDDSIYVSDCYSVEYSPAQSNTPFYAIILEKAYLAVYASLF